MSIISVLSNSAKVVTGWLKSEQALQKGILRHKKRKHQQCGVSYSSGEQDRTADLRVMNPAL